MEKAYPVLKNKNFELEGGLWRRPGYRKFVQNIAKNLQPKIVLEIGFNGGHGAATILDEKSVEEFITFDICRWGYEKEAWEILHNDFSYPISVVVGDSVESVPAYHEQNPGKKYDLIIVDGFHFDDHPYLDLKNTFPLLSDDGFLLLDDLNVPAVKMGFEKFMKENQSICAFAIPNYSLQEFIPDSIVSKFPKLKNIQKSHIDGIDKDCVICWKK